MDGLSHVILHIGLCSSIARTKAQTPVAIHVSLLDRGNVAEYDHVYKFARGEEDTTEVEFDVHRGTFRLLLDADNRKCTAYDYLFFMPDHDRNVTETLSDGVVDPTQPMLLSGAAPMSFSYVKPTFVLVDKSVACKAPIGTPLPTQIQVERDRDGYYTWLYTDPQIDALGSVTVALRLGTTSGQFHYVRVPMQFPVGWGGWPATIEFNVTEDQIDDLATDPTGVLLCPKLWKTSSG